MAIISKARHSECSFLFLVESLSQSRSEISFDASPACNLKTTFLQIVLSNLEPNLGIQRKCS